MKSYIIGCDEVGYGALSGPLVVFAVRASNTWSMDGLNDSKKLTDKQRRTMNEKLRSCSDITFVGTERSNITIDQFGVSVAIHSSYQEVTKQLYQDDSLIIIDGNLNFDHTLVGMDYKTIIKADGKIPAVMAASILAKVYRDDLMIKMSKDFPYYLFDKNKGYGSPQHLAAIKEHGLCSIHRTSYKLKNNDI